MSFSKWLEDNYPDRVRDSAESYQLIKKAKRNTRFLSVIAIFLVCFPTYYICSIVSSNLGFEFAQGVGGFLVFLLGFVFSSFAFLLVNNHLIKKELSKLVRS